MYYYLYKTKYIYKKVFIYVVLFSVVSTISLASRVLTTRKLQVGTPSSTPSLRLNVAKSPQHDRPNQLRRLGRHVGKCWETMPLEGWQTVHRPALIGEKSEASEDHVSHADKKKYAVKPATNPLAPVTMNGSMSQTTPNRSFKDGKIVLSLH